MYVFPLISLSLPSRCQMSTLIWPAPLKVLMARFFVRSLRTLGRGDKTDALVDRDPDIGVHDIDGRGRLDLPSSAGVPSTERRKHKEGQTTHLDDLASLAVVVHHRHRGLDEGSCGVRTTATTVGNKKTEREGKRGQMEGLTHGIASQCSRGCRPPSQRSWSAP